MAEDSKLEIESRRGFLRGAVAFSVLSIVPSMPSLSHAGIFDRKGTYENPVVNKIPEDMRGGNLDILMDNARLGFLPYFVKKGESSYVIFEEKAFRDLGGCLNMPEGAHRIGYDDLRDFVDMGPFDQYLQVHTTRMHYSTEEDDLVAAWAFRRELDRYSLKATREDDGCISLGFKERIDYFDRETNGNEGSGPGPGGDNGKGDGGGGPSGGGGQSGHAYLKKRFFGSVNTA